jgi:serine/threonine protein kinase
VIADFGLAKVADLTTMTSSGTTLGTIVYMPPEAFDTLRKTDHRGDIWALGIIFFQMLTGVLPFRGETQMQIIGAILNENPYSLSLHRRDLPPAWEMMITQCLEKSPENRYQSVQDIMADLNELPRVRRDPISVNRDESEYESRFIDVTLQGDELVHRPKSEFRQEINTQVEPNLTEALDYTERWAPKEGAQNKTSLEILIISSIFVWGGIIGVFGGALISVLSITDFRDEIGVSDSAVQGMLIGGSLLFIIGVTFEAVADAKYRFVLFALAGLSLGVWLAFFSGLLFPEDFDTLASFMGTMLYIVVFLGYFQFRRS